MADRQQKGHFTKLIVSESVTNSKRQDLDKDNRSLFGKDKTTSNIKPSPRISMKKMHQICLALVAMSIPAIACPLALAQSIGISKPQQPKFSLIPSIFYATQSGQVSYGAEAKFSISNEFSARPFAAFSGSGNLSGVALTYDFPAATDVTPGSANAPLDQINSSGASPSTSAWFVGAGGLVRNVAGVSTGVKPFALVGSNVGLLKVDLKYVFDNSELIGSAGINLSF